MLNPSSHKLSMIYTSQYRYDGPNRIDVTVKSAPQEWKPFAPTWDMVKGTKNGTLSEEEYVRLYLNILDKVPAVTWDAILKYDYVVFICFCSKDAFCHRNILTRYIIKTLNNRVAYGGWCDANTKANYPIR